MSKVVSTPEFWATIFVLTFIILDYVTGVIKAIMYNELSSQKMRKGLGHKFAYIVVLFVAWLFDFMQYFLDFGIIPHVYILAAMSIIVTEAISLCENLVIINPELQNVKFFTTFVNTLKHKDAQDINLEHKRKEEK